MAAASVKVQGIDALKRELKLFSPAVQARVIDSGIRKAAGKLRTYIRREAYAAPAKGGYKFTKTLRRAIRYASGKRGGPKAGKAWIGLKKIKGEGAARNYYRVLEFGRKAYAKKTGPVAASPQPMRPFFARAWNARRQEIAEMLVMQTRVAIAREAGRAYGRARAGR